MIVSRIDHFIRWRQSYIVSEVKSVFTFVEKISSLQMGREGEKQM